MYLSMKKSSEAVKNFSYSFSIENDKLFIRFECPYCGKKQKQKISLKKLDHNTSLTFCTRCRDRFVMKINTNFFIDGISLSKIKSDGKISLDNPFKK